MSIVDVIILILVVLFLGSIIYFRWIKKDPNGLNCNCYKRKSCSLKMNELKHLLNRDTKSE